KNDRSPDAGKRVLHRVNGFQIRFDAGRFKQPLHNDGFVFLLGVENLDQFLVGLGLRRGVSRLWHVVLRKLSVNRLRQSPCPCLADHKGVRPREACFARGSWHNGDWDATRGTGQHPISDIESQTGAVWKFKGPNSQTENTMSARTRTGTKKRPEDCAACR